MPNRFDLLSCIAIGGITALLYGCGGSGTSGTDSPELDSLSASSSTQISNSEDTQSTIEIAFETTPESSTFDPFAVFSFAAAGASGFECRLDDAHYEPCASPKQVMPLEEGAHEFEVRALDDSSSVLASATHNWSVKSILPIEESNTAHSDLVPTTVMPSAADPQSWRGIFRINCDFAHSSYNDPIVFPGERDAAHLHRFYGNTLLDEASTVESLFTTGESSCQGNHLNRSAYWIPALLAPLYNQTTGQRELDEHGEPAWQVVPAVVGNDDVAHEIFYYSAGVDDLDSIQSIPLGLKMIAGNHMASPDDQQSTSIVRWHCQSWESSDGENPRWSTSIPECIAPDRVRMDIFFPSCWNGTDLDSFDHKSHMAYPTNQGGPNGTQCPATHPVPILRVSFHYAFGVKPDVYEPATLSSSGWRLASDAYDLATEGAGGMSLHGDWLNAWHPEALQTLLDTCVKGGLDCHDGNLANGFRLSGTQPGTQIEPEVLNSGLGLHHH